jgi:anti-anti-sigma factor
MDSIELPQDASPGIMVINLEGEFDLAERARLTDAFAIATSVPVVVVNFEKVGYVDSTALQCLTALELATRKRGARLILTGLSPAIGRVFRLAELDHVFEIRPTLREIAMLDPARVRRLTLVSASMDGKV